MNVGNLAARIQVTANGAALQRLLSCRWEPLFHADWVRVLLVHYELEPAALQAAVPFRLDLREGRAYVSFVAFTQRGLRPRFGGRMSARLFKPIATHEYLNVRTYVRHRGEAGIYFLAEWLNNATSVRLGPWPFGLPYRFGHLDYRYGTDGGELNGVVNGREKGQRLAYRGQLNPGLEFEPCRGDSLEEFLMERYTAFTQRGAHGSYFRVWHEPWLQVPIQVEVLQESLLTANWQWFKQAKLVGANYSPGVVDVKMGWPHRIAAEREHR